MPSMYEPFQTEIENMLSLGYSVAEIYQQRFANQGFSVENLRYFCKTRKLIENNKKSDCINCDSCNECGRIKPYFTGQNRIDIRYCKVINQQINPTISTSPVWCPRLESGGNK